MSLVLLLHLQMPSAAASRWSKARTSILSLSRLKNSAFYKKLPSELRVPYPLPDRVHTECVAYDAWRDPLSGSTPYEEMIEPTWDLGWDGVLASETRDDFVMNAWRTLPVLVQMLDVYQGVGLFNDWRTRVLDDQERVMPMFVWSRPWSLEVTARDQTKPGRMYTLLTTYARILHYYACVLKEEHSRKRSLSKVIRDAVTGNAGKRAISHEVQLFRRGGWELRTVQKRVFGVDDVGHYDTVEESLFLMMGQVYLTLPDVNDDVIAGLTLENEVEKAVRRVRSSQSIAMRIYYRALLCLELHQFMSAIADEDSWLPDDLSDDEAEEDDVNNELVDLEKMISKLVKLENEVIKVEGNQ